MTQPAPADELREAVEQAAKAAGFHDPTDAVGLGGIDPTDPTLTRDGKPDAAAVKTAVDAALTAKPYLADPSKADPPARRGTRARGSAHQGARGGGDATGSDTVDRHLARARAATGTGPQSTDTTRTPTATARSQPTVDRHLARARAGQRRH